MYWDIVVAAVASIILGFLWYGPIFGKTWMKMMGFTAKDIEKGRKKNMAPTYVMMVISTLLMASVLKIVLIQFPFVRTFSIVVTAAMLWLGFIAPVQLGTVLWEGKSWSLYLLNTSYYLVNLVVMALILTSFG